ncbi:MAG: TetR family transcriptional regulator [Ralstonia sp.]|uniref:TetR family transcriptional regulator n=1 Tax=Ralstonia sp. TaxID=54061 RepID=UPI003F8217B1
MPRPRTAKAPISVAPDAPPKTRNRKRTLEELNKALSRLQRSGEKITLKAVADEAGVSAPLLNNRYPDFAEQVRAIVGKSVRQQRNKKADLLTQEREKNHKLRELNKSQLVEIVRLASVNEALRAEIALCKAIAENKVTKADFGRKR